MVDEQISAEDQEELNQVAQLVAKSLSEGKSQADIASQLVANGWDQETAETFVSNIAISLANAQSHAAQSSGGGGMGWLVWIGLLLFINLLSYLFNWPFWIY